MAATPLAWGRRGGTNQTGELCAAAEALAWLQAPGADAFHEGPVEIVTDSAYTMSILPAEEEGKQRHNDVLVQYSRALYMFL